jgi:hypothetical protein
MGGEMEMRTGLMITACVLTVLSSIAPALAFQQTMTCYESGLYRCRPGEVAKAAFWPAAGREPAIPGRTEGPDYFVYPKGVGLIEGQESDEMSEALLVELQAGFQVWNDVECSPLEMKFLGMTSISAQESFQTSNRQDNQGKACAWNDKECLEDETSTSLGLCGDSDPPVCEHANILVFRPTNWPVHYASTSAFAITSVNVDPATGQIMDADIEFNLEFQSLGVDEWSSEPSQTVDIRNTVTHEAGHVLGLDHSEDEEATMYRRAEAGEVKKRDLSEDDVEGLCAIYPNSPLLPEPPRPVPAEEGCCTVVASPHPNQRIALLLFVLCLCVGGRKPRVRNAGF